MFIHSEVVDYEIYSQKKYILELAMIFKLLKTEENNKSGRMEL